MTAWPPTTPPVWRDIRVGDQLPDMVIDVTATRIVAGAIASRDFMPVHHDRSYANAQGAPDIFMNILSDTGYCSRFLTDWAGPEAMIRRLAIRLGVPLFPDTVLTYSGSVTGTRIEEGEGIVEVELRASTALGDHVTGSAVLTLPLSRRPGPSPRMVWEPGVCRRWRCRFQPTNLSAHLSLCLLILFANWRIYRLRPISVSSSYRLETVNGAIPQKNNASAPGANRATALWSYSPFDPPIWLRATGSSGVLGCSDVHIQPLSERRGGSNELDDPALGLRGAEPCSDRPLLPGGDALQTEKVDSGMVLRVAPGGRLEGRMGGHLDPLFPQSFDKANQLPAPLLVRNGGPEARELIGRRHVEPRAHAESIRGQRNVAGIVVSGDRCLVRRLVGTESRVAIGAKDVALTEFGRQLGHQGLHGTENTDQIEVLVRRPVGLGVVYLEFIEELDDARLPSSERGTVLQWEGWSTSG